MTFLKFLRSLETDIDAFRDQEATVPIFREFARAWLYRAVRCAEPASEN